MAVDGLSVYLTGASFPKGKKLGDGDPASVDRDGKNRTDGAPAAYASLDPNLNLNNLSQAIFLILQDYLQKMAEHKQEIIDIIKKVFKEDPAKARELKKELEKKLEKLKEIKAKLLSGTITLEKLNTIRGLLSEIQGFLRGLLNAGDVDIGSDLVQTLQGKIDDTGKTIDKMDKKLRGEDGATANNSDIDLVRLLRWQIQV